MFVDFEEETIINNQVDRVFNIVRLLGIGGNERIERFLAASRRIGCVASRRIFQIVGRKKTHQLADHRQAIGVVPRNEMSNAALLVVSHRAAKFLLADFLVRDGLDDVRTSDEHI